MDEMIKLSMQNEVKTIGSMSAVINLFGYSRCEDSDIKYQKKTLKEDSFWRTVLGQDAIKIPGYDDCVFWIESPYICFVIDVTWIDSIDM